MFRLTLRGFALLIVLMSAGSIAWAQGVNGRSLDGWSQRIEAALSAGNGEEAVREISATIDMAPKQAMLYLMRGSLLFRMGKIEESIVDFDRCAELDPAYKPQLWQRGIALYYAGRFEDSRDQFAIHRDVNPNDVENAFWHFLCNVKLIGREKAEKEVLLAGFDSRVPLMQVQELIQGKAKPDAIAEAIEAKFNSKRSGQLAKFYGYLYLGLYFDALGDFEKARGYLESSVAQGIDGYMNDVAKVHLVWMKERSKSK